MNDKHIIVNSRKFELLLSKDKIQERVKEISSQISNDYKDKDLMMLCVLKGSIFFTSDLMRNMDIESELQTIRAKSYGSSMKSQGTVKLSDFDVKLSGRNILIVEDIIDSGFTVNALKNYILQFHPESVEIAALLSKPDMRIVNLEIKYVGFEIEPRFVVGYGLDFAEQGRRYPDIYAVELPKED